MFRALLATLLVSLICTPIAATEKTVALQSAKQFFKLFAERKDFDAFMAMYAENAELQDINYGDHKLGRNAIREFFQWDAGNVKLLEGKTLELDTLVNDGNHVVARGHFGRFEYGGQEMGPWRFVIWLEFDEKGKIIKQTDWINYTPKDQFTGGKNMNELINKG